MATVPRKPRAARTKPLRVDVPALQRTLGERIRAGRHARRLTLAAFAELSGLSRRFLTELELGRANVSLQGLAKVADALGVTPAALVAPAQPSHDHDELRRLLELLPVHAHAAARTALEQLLTVSPEPRHIALVGLRGAGKTTLGRAAAAKAGLRFVELDQLVEEAAGMPLSDLFTLHGETWYRQLERDALQKLVADERPLVVATGGGIVMAADTYALLRRTFVTIWLKATPEEHWNRVVEQGDHRPMRGQPTAMARLREILAERAPLYGMARHVVDTSALGPLRSVEKIEAIVKAAASVATR